MGIEFLPNCSVEKAEPGKVYLTNSDVLNNAMLIWAAGVRVSDFISGLNVEKNTQGRMKVDDYLRVREDCFVAGDAAYFQHEGKFLRMAVQFSIVEGSVAARNVINSALRRPLKKYKPVDLGYIIPLANNNSCGTILGRDIKGVPATMMHFSMCIFRSAGFRNKIGVLKNLINNKRRAL
jgi:NADH dehydrogenase